jgi:uncharacterized protein GlcG (DUF336 family)
MLVSHLALLPDGFTVRTHLASFAIIVPLMAAASIVQAQDYLLPDAPGKAEVTGACETCHGIIEVIKHKRSPRQWSQIVQQMIVQGAALSDTQRKDVIAYLNAEVGQPNDYIPEAPPLRGVGPGLALALQAAEGAQEACRAKGREVTTLVVDAAGVPIVLLTGDGVKPITQSDAASKVATVLRYKEPSGVVMKRMNKDPVLVAETRNDPQIGEVLDGGLPIIVSGNRIIGAIAVSGAFGPADFDDYCAQAGIDRIRAGLAKLASGLEPRAQR